MTIDWIIGVVMLGRVIQIESPMKSIRVLLGLGRCQRLILGEPSNGLDVHQVLDPKQLIDSWMNSNEDLLGATRI